MILAFSEEYSKYERHDTHTQGEVKRAVVLHHDETLFFLLSINNNVHTHLARLVLIFFFLDTQTIQNG